MGYEYDITNYSERYKEYGAKLLQETEATLNKAGIKIFPMDSSSKDENTNSCVIVNTKNSAPKEPMKKKSSNKKDSKEKNLFWVLESLPTSENVLSIHSNINKKANEAQAKKASISHETNNNQGQTSSENSTGDDNYDNNYNEYDVYGAGEDTDNVETVSNASGDEGDDTLKTFFEKDIKDEGFSSNNFLGGNYERDITSNENSNNISGYTVNMLKYGNFTSVIGGTINVAYNPSDGGGTSNQLDYNAFAYGKYKASKFTYGAGALGTKKDSVNNVTIDVGAMHNDTGIYAIVKKELIFVPGLPTQSHTDVNIGIGKSSGYLNPSEYFSEDKSVQEITDVDNKAQEVNNQESGILDDVTTDDKSKYGSTIASLVFSQKPESTEIGVKFGHLSGYMTKNNNYAFFLPGGQITNVTLNSDDGSSTEGARLILNVNAGEKANLSNGWQISTKGLVEASRTVMTGSRPSDYLLANLCFKANTSNNKFSSELSLGGYVTNTDTHTKYTELKLSYNPSDDLSINLKGGYADSKFGNNSNQFFQIAGGISYNF